MAREVNQATSDRMLMIGMLGFCLKVGQLRINLINNYIDANTYVFSFLEGDIRC